MEKLCIYPKRHLFILAYRKSNSLATASTSMFISPIMTSWLHCWTQLQHNYFHQTSNKDKVIFYLNKKIKYNFKNFILFHSRYWSWKIIFYSHEMCTCEKKCWFDKRWLQSKKKIKDRISLELIILIFLRLFTVVVIIKCLTMCQIKGQWILATILHI